MSRLIQERKIKKLLGWIYPTPDPLHSEEELLQFTHQDLANMTKAELNREWDRVKWCLLFDGNPYDWLIQREERLRTLIHTGKHNE